jgi:hypothetical protein
MFLWFAPRVDPPQRPFLDIEMPDEFVLEALTATGDWIDWAKCRASEFERLDDGAYVCQGEGSPIWLRCLRQDGSILYVVDGAGDPYTYRLVPFPGERYQPS